MSITAVLCVRNEAAFLLDWLAWHRSIGITDFVVVSNDCDDGTDLVLDRLETLGWLTHIRNAPPFGKGGIQFSGLKLAGKADAVKRADWLVALDIDEFVTVHVGDRTLPALISALPDATAITLTWRNFGNAGVVDYKDQPVPLQFTHAGPRPLLWPWRAAMFKTLYRNDRTYGTLGCTARAIRWKNGLPRRAGLMGTAVRCRPRWRRGGFSRITGCRNMGWCSSIIIRLDRWKAMCSRLIGAAPSTVQTDLGWITGWSGTSTPKRITRRLIYGIGPRPFGPTLRQTRCLQTCMTVPQHGARRASNGFWSRTYSVTYTGGC